jgi:hypothetical protein
MWRPFLSVVLSGLVFAIFCAPLWILIAMDRSLFAPIDIAWLILVAILLCAGFFVLRRLTENKSQATCWNCGDCLAENPVCASCGAGGWRNEAAVYDASADFPGGPLGLSRNEWSRCAVIGVVCACCLANICIERRVPWPATLSCISTTTILVSQFRRHREQQVIYQRFRQGRCLHCGYDLTANTSGVCPECGTAVLRKPEVVA